MNQASSLRRRVKPSKYEVNPKHTNMVLSASPPTGRQLSLPLAVRIAERRLAGALVQEHAVVLSRDREDAFSFHRLVEALYGDACTHGERLLRHDISEHGSVCAGCWWEPRGH